MILTKPELKRFLIWMRNGTCFAVTWFLILLLAGTHGLGVPAIPVALLVKMVVLVAGGVLLFCVSFTKLLLVRWSFFARIGFFIGLFSVYQAVGFYWIGFFQDSGTALRWGIYGGIMLACYLLCLLIYHLFYRKEREVYTQALREYQKKRAAL